MSSSSSFFSLEDHMDPEITTFPIWKLLSRMHVSLTLHNTESFVIGYVCAQYRTDISSPKPPNLRTEGISPYRHYTPSMWNHPQFETEFQQLNVPRCNSSESNHGKWLSLSPEVQHPIFFGFLKTINITSQESKAKRRQVVRKNAFDIDKINTWHFSIFVGGNNRGDVKIGFLAS